MSTGPCPICGNSTRTPGWRTVVDPGVEPGEFRPSSDRFGRTIAPLLRCTRCGHASVDVAGDDDRLLEVYEGVIDDASDGEDQGRAATAARDLVTLERFATRGRLLDIGCWTGALLEVAAARGWEVEGLEPSAWAAERARERGLAVVEGGVPDLPAAFVPGRFDAIVCCDVVEHLADPVAALRLMRDALGPAGTLLLTVPDAGSPVARMLRGRWWSVLPMHLHYFTRGSLRLALTSAGFRTVHVARHPKAFSSGYYAGRVAAAVPAMRGVATAAANSRLGQRTVAPNLHDRLIVVARRG